MICSMGDEEINQKIAECAKLEAEQRRIMGEDPKVLKVKDELKVLLEPYREDIKGAKLRIDYATMVLNNRGKE